MPLAWSQYICTSMYMMDKKVCCSRDTGKYLYFYSPQQYPGRAFRREVGERSGHNRVNQHHVKGFTDSLPSVRGRAFIGFTGSLHTEGLHSQDSLAPYTQTQGLHSQDSLAPYSIHLGTEFTGFTGFNLVFTWEIPECHSLLLDSHQAFTSPESFQNFLELSTLYVFIKQ